MLCVFSWTFFCTFGDCFRVFSWVFREWLPALPVPPPRLLHNAACGFAGMHAKGKVHRDIKPGNIVIVGGPAEETLQAKVADFGLTCGEQQQ